MKNIDVTNLAVIGCIALIVITSMIVMGASSKEITMTAVGTLGGFLGGAASANKNPSDQTGNLSK